MVFLGAYRTHCFVGLLIEDADVGELVENRRMGRAAVNCKPIDDLRRAGGYRLAQARVFARAIPPHSHGLSYYMSVFMKHVTPCFALE